MRKKDRIIKNYQKEFLKLKGLRIFLNIYSAILSQLLVIWLILKFKPNIQMNTIESFIQGLIPMSVISLLCFIIVYFAYEQFAILMMKIIGGSQNGRRKESRET